MLLRRKKQTATCRPTCRLQGPVQPIDLETWIVEAAELQAINDEEQQPIAMTESESKSEKTCTHPTQSACFPSARQISVPAMLQTLPPDYRSPTVQIGFNFAESESYTDSLSRVTRQRRNRCPANPQNPEKWRSGCGW